MKVVIATPTNSGQMYHQYVASLFGSIPLLQREGFSLLYYPIPGQLIDHARNLAAARAITQGADKLLFLDDDVSWRPEDLAGLLKTPHSVIGGTYRKKNVYKESYAVGLPEEIIPDEYGMLPANHLPAGFLKIETYALKEMSKNMEPYPHPNVLGTEEESNMFPFFKVLTNAQAGHSGGESEDTYFCVEWRRAGGQCWLYPDAKVEHITEVSLKNDFKNYLDRITSPFEPPGENNSSR